MHARIENGLVVEYPIVNLRQRLPEVSLPADLKDDSALPEGFVYVHPSPLPAFNQATHKVLPKALPTFDGQRWVHAYDVTPLTSSELLEVSTSRAQAALQARRQAYQDEADPLFFQWQRGDATQQQWLDKIAEIKARLP